MSRIRKILAAFVFFLIFLSGLAALSVVFLVRPDAVRGTLVQVLEEVTNDTFEYSEFHLAYWPSFEAVFRDVSFSAGRDPRLDFKIPEMKIGLRVLAGLFRKTDISKAEIREGDVVFSFSRSPTSRLAVHHVFLRADSVKRNQPAELSYSADLRETKKVIQGKTTILLSPEISDWRAAAVHGAVRIDRLALADWSAEALAGADVRITGGVLSGRAEFDKKKDERLNFKSRGEVEHLIYETGDAARGVASPEIEARWGVDGVWNLKTQQLHLKSASLTSPVAKINAGGEILFESGEVRDFRIAASNLSMENIPQFVIPLKTAVPVNVGFSGESNFEASVEGTFDHLSLHANWDWTPSLLAYGRYFSKPKGMPLNLIFDFLVKDSKMLSGDFSVAFRGAAVKGAFTNWNAASGEGQVNIITNKFSLAGWEELLPPFENYSIAGDMKILADFKGSTASPNKAQVMFNWTYENGAIRKKNGPAMEDIHLAVDYSPLSAELKQGRFRLGGTTVRVSSLIYNLLENPTGKAKVEAFAWPPSEFFPALLDLAGGVISPSWKARIQAVQKNLETAAPAVPPVKYFSTVIQFKEKEFSIPRLRVEAYGGRSIFRVKADFKKQPAECTMDAKIRRVDLAKFFTRPGINEPPVEGRFFLDGHFTTAADPSLWRDRLKGVGEFRVTRALFRTFDLPGQIAKINGLSAVPMSKPGVTAFDEARSQFVFDKKKVTTEKLTAVSPDYSVLAKGEILGEDSVNYSADVYLPREGKFLGPVPFLLAGPLAKPELKADPTKLPQFEDELLKKKMQKALRQSLPDEFLRGSRKSS